MFFSGSTCSRALCTTLLTTASTMSMVGCPSDDPVPGADTDTDTDTSTTGDTDTDTLPADGSDTLGPDCPPGEERCDGACVDIFGSLEHCGGCGLPCAAGETCEAGTCQLQCGEFEELCDGVCVDTNEDIDHCGGCGNGCEGLDECVDGQCEFPGCEFGELCGDSCVDTNEDLDHCGECDNPCPVGGEGDAVCAVGECGYDCPEGLADCDPMVDGCEADLSSPMACGDCMHVCERGDTCMAPDCMATRELVDNGDFSADLTGWSTDNNPTDSSDTMIMFSVDPAGALSNGSSTGPNAKVAYQDLTIPTGMFTAAEFSLCFFQDMGGFDPANVTVIQADPGDANGGGPQNAFRIDLVDPAEDLFAAPILLELHAPDAAVGAPDACQVVMFDDPTLAMLLQTYEGQTLRLRVAQVESTFPWSLTVDDVSLQVSYTY